MKLILIALSAVLAVAMAQDTFHCPDGWTLHEHEDHCGCFLFSGSERVTREDADILCAFHDGAWVAEPNRPGQELFIVGLTIIIIMCYRSQLLDEVTAS